MIKDINYRYNQNPENIDEKKPKGAEIFNKTVKTQLFRAQQDIGKWKAALNLAESVHRPNRTQLIKIYNELMLDNHLTSQIMIRKNQILSQKYFFVGEDGKRNEEFTKLIHDQWFRKFMDIVMDSIFYGYELIEFGGIKDNKFITVNKIREEYLVPEWGIVKRTLFSQDRKNDIQYLKKPYSDWTLPIGNPQYDFGLLNKAARFLIFKSNVSSNWADFSNVFGMPLRIGRTEISDPLRKQSMINELKDMGAAAYMVMGLDDKVEFVQSSSSDAYQVYSELINTANSEVSKLINGAAALGDEKSFVGSSQVNERLMYAGSIKDKFFIADTVNNQLVPFMKMHQLIPSNLELKFKFGFEEILSVEKAAVVIKDLTVSGYEFDDKEISDKIGFKVVKKEIVTPTSNQATNKIENSETIFAEASELYSNFFKENKEIN